MRNVNKLGIRCVMVTWFVDPDVGGELLFPYNTSRVTGFIPHRPASFSVRHLARFVYRLFIVSQNMRNSLFRDKELSFSIVFKRQEISRGQDVVFVTCLRIKIERETPSDNRDALVEVLGAPSGHSPGTLRLFKMDTLHGTTCRYLESTYLRTLIKVSQTCVGNCATF